MSKDIALMLLAPGCALFGGAFARSLARTARHDENCGALGAYSIVSVLLRASHDE